MLDHYCGKSLKHLQLLQPNDPAVAAGVWEVVAAAAAAAVVAFVQAASFALRKETTTLFS
jgi:hypothetical protein